MNFTLDVVCLQKTGDVDAEHRAWLFTAPAVYGAAHELPFTAFDCAAISGVTGTRRDGLLLVDSTGLKLVTLPADGEWSIQTLATGDWAGARMVRCGSLVDASSTYCVALMADRETLVFRGPSGSYWYMGSTERVLDMLPLDFTGSGSEDYIAVLTGWGLRIRNIYTGEILLAQEGAGLGSGVDLIHRLDRTGQSRSSLVWIDAGPGVQDQSMYVFDHLGPPEGPYDLGWEVTGLTVVDVDGDLDQDVLFTTEHSYHVVGLENLENQPLPGGATFSPSPRYVTHYLLRRADGTPISGAPILPASPPVSGDMDGDGDSDTFLAFVDQAVGADVVLLNTTEDEDQYRVDFKREFHSLAFYRADTLMTALRGDEVIIPPEATDLLVWGYELLDFTEHESFSGGGTLYTFAPDEVQLSLFLPGKGDSESYLLLMQYARLGPTGVERCWPAVAYFCVPEDHIVPELREATPSSFDWIMPVYFHLPPTGPPPIPEELGGAGIPPEIPDKDLLPPKRR